MVATVVKVGSELSVNSTTADYQFAPSVAALSGGGFVMVWIDYSATGADTAATAVRGQRFDAGGAKVGGEFLVNTVTAGAQTEAVVTARPDGGYLVTWTDASHLGGDASLNALKGQLFDTAGGKVGAEFLVNTTTPGNQDGSSTGVAADGAFIVAWSSADPVTGLADIVAQRFSASGAKLGGEFTVNTVTASAQAGVQVAALDGGGYALVWLDLSKLGGDSSGSSIKAQVIDAAGAKIGAEFLVNIAVLGSQVQPSIAALDGGGFVVAWADDRNANGLNEYVKAQRFTAAGVKVGAELTVTTDPSLAYIQPKVAALDGGGFVVSWQENADGTGSDHSAPGIRAQRYTDAGVKLGDAFFANTAVANAQSQPTAAGLADGRFVIGWSDLSGVGADHDGAAIKAQVFAPAAVNTAPVAVNDTVIVNGRTQVTHGNVLFNDTDVNGDALHVATGVLYGVHAQVTFQMDGGYQIAVTQPAISSNVTEIFHYQISDNKGGVTNANLVVVFQPRAIAEGVTLTGDGGANRLEGTAGRDHLFGLAGNDRLNGGAGYDEMVGGLGDDIYFVDDIDDTVVEKPGEGSDIVYVATPSYTLAAGQEIEFVRAQPLVGGVVILGNEFGTKFISAGGDDTFRGLDGDDSYYLDSIGDVVEEYIGGGVDTVYTCVSYELTGRGEIENLRANGATTGLSLTANEYANQVVGGAFGDTLRGGAGNDRLQGLAGDDRLVGGAGRDTLTDGDGVDVFQFDAGDSAATATGYDTITDFAAGETIDLSSVTSGVLDPAAYREVAVASNTFSTLLSAAQSAAAGGGVKAVFVAGVSDGWLFWDTDGTLTTFEGAVRLQGLKGLNAFDNTGIV